MRWKEHIVRMAETRKTYKILLRKSEGEHNNLDIRTWIGG
jgi:hypothetical protein